jgi:anti-sigma factor RsiW
VSEAQGSPAVAEAELHAWVDGRLPEARRAAVAAWLEAHPEDRRRVAAWQQQNELIQELYGDITREPVPERLTLPRLMGRRRGLWWARAAAAVLLLAVGAAGGWLAHDRLGGTRVGSSAVAAYGVEAHRVFTNEVRHAVEVDASQDEHLIAWLSKRLDHPLRAPDLKPLGLELLGGRLLVTPDGEPAAQLMYEDASAARFTLYVTRHLEPRPTAFRWSEEQGLGAFYWQERDMGYAIIGAAPKDRLLAISRRVYAELEEP